jgi:hypothetical protein
MAFRGIDPTIKGAVMGLFIRSGTRVCRLLLVASRSIQSGAGDHFVLFLSAPQTVPCPRAAPRDPIGVPPPPCLVALC